MEDLLLREIGTRVRALREGADLARHVVAEKAGLSLRFLAGVEAGEANISILNLAALANALGTTPVRLLGGIDSLEPAESAAGAVEVTVSVRVALLGARGAGKSTVGKRLAKRLRLRFVELDAWVEEGAGLSLSEIFSLHGEAYYRRLEREALERALEGHEGFVLAAGGSLVTAEPTFARLKEASTTVWLRADAAAHWERVLSQGERRPSGENPNAMNELRALLKARAPLYARADHIVDTHELDIEGVADAVLALVVPPKPDEIAANRR